MRVLRNVFFPGTKMHLIRGIGIIISIPEGLEFTLFELVLLFF